MVGWYLHFSLSGSNPSAPLFLSLQLAGTKAEKAFLLILRELSEPEQ